MTLIFIKFKDGCVESHEIEHFTMVGSTIRMETKDNIEYFEYDSIESIEIINP
jgi:hypothetical protein